MVSAQAIGARQSQRRQSAGATTTGRNLIRIAPARATPRSSLRRSAAAVVLPHVLVDKVVEVEMLEVLELAARGGEQLLAHPHVLVHGAADVEKQQYLDGIVPLRHQLQIQQPAVACRGVDGALQIQLLSRALARELAQPAQRQLEVARAELDAVVEVAVLAQLPHLHRAPLATGVVADADALRVEAARAEG